MTVATTEIVFVFLFVSIAIVVPACYFLLKNKSEPNNAQTHQDGNNPGVNENKRLEEILAPGFVPAQQDKNGEQNERKTKRHEDLTLGISSVYVLIVTFVVLSWTCIAIISQVEEMRKFMGR